MLQALPMLANICLATLFLLWLFAIIGLQFYQGSYGLRFSCPRRALPFPAVG